MTLKDIAKIVDLSESTVSRALNNNPNIAKKTRELVMKVAEEHNFVINPHARNLATKRSYRIGIIFPNDFYEFNKRDFFSQLEKYFLLNSEKNQYEILIIRAKSLEKTIKSGNVDGLIVVNRDISKNDLEVLKNYKVPHTFVAYKPTFLEEETIVFKSDNVNCGYNVAKFLHSNGCKNLLTITSENEGLTDYQDRTLGFYKYLEEKKLLGYETHIYKCGMTFEDGRELVLNQLELLKKFDGIFVQQDKVALGMLSLIEKYGIKVPENLKIIGHDNIELIDYFYPKLTSIKQKFEEITLRALNYLINIIENKENKDVKFTFESEIINRETTKN
ncbi:LacI family DNA-binding transcriptional regulator [Cetobacterium sp. 8H]|uniref:LacI family DNA-binding transcriptional regulator n=1 Tax=Cetobacterium sp. 8H TaxID=2759681 RepID=UPI00163B8E93|nr:LacI family DNA-binding transcriptional regulator [Cetobacterium sp. 8H]MBC2850907.1 LacI family DNA-binding transcriptional regulator [Cetobacterium sp. 8H]